LLQTPPTAGDDLMLSVRGVNVRFGSLRALTDVSVDVPAGRIVGLIGPNGAGKSTLLGVIGGQQRATSGGVQFHGREISRLTPSARARIGLRRTFQNLELFDDMSVRDNVLVGMPPDRHGWTFPRAGGRRGESPAAKLRSLIGELGLDRYADAKAGALPAPVRRMVSYARAVAGRPQCVLLDEPAAGLSERDRHDLASRIKLDVANAGMCAVVVEHDMGFVRHLCDHIYFLSAGAVLTTGTFEEVAAAPGVREAYLGKTRGSDQ
jgi:branched-chain amino acid transport system permease protein